MKQQMKNKKILITLTLFLSTLSSTIVHAAGGSGVRGGGHIVEVGGKKELFDLVTRNRCNEVSAEKMIANNPYYTQLLQKISEAHWYFAEDILKATHELTFCFTQGLYRVAPQQNQVTPGTVILPDPKLKVAVQGAVRVGNRVYWDTKEANQLTERSRAFLILHEVMHSYLNWNQNEDERYISLWSIVAEISDFEAGLVGHDAEQLFLTMQANQIQFPTNPDVLEPYQSQIRFITAQYNETRYEMIQQSQSPESLLIDLSSLDHDESTRLATALSKWDHETIFKQDQLEKLKNDIRALMKSSTVTEFEILLNHKTYKNIDPLLVALSIKAKALGVEKMYIIENSERYSKLFSAYYEKLEALKQPFIKEGRIVISFSDQTQYLIEQKPRKLNVHAGGFANVDTNGFVGLVVNHVKEEKWSSLEKHVFQNDRFYASLGVKKQKQELLALKPLVPRELELAASIYDELNEQFLKDVFEAIKQGLKKEQYENFISKIDFEKFKN